MTITTDRLAATTKTSEKPGNCWVLTDEHGADHDDYGLVVHHASVSAALSWAVSEEIEGYAPRQLDKPCMVIRCTCCGYVFDEDEDGIVHFEDLGEARKVLAAADGGTVADDGTAKCQPCATGECDECAPVSTSEAGAR